MRIKTTTLGATLNVGERILATARWEGRRRQVTLLHTPGQSRYTNHKIAADHLAGLLDHPPGLWVPTEDRPESILWENIR
jgi:hypothetical protein